MFFFFLPLRCVLLFSRGSLCFSVFFEGRVTVLCANGSLRAGARMPVKTSVVAVQFARSLGPTVGLAARFSRGGGRHRRLKSRLRWWRSVQYGFFRFSFRVFERQGSRGPVEASRERQRERAREKTTLRERDSERAREVRSGS
jgi:hypothetical protein